MLAEGISFGSVPANLCTFLIQRACTNATLANYFYWYLSIEVEEVESVRKQDEKAHDMYAMVLKMFLKVLENGGCGFYERKMISLTILLSFQETSIFEASFIISGSSAASSTSWSS